MIFNDFTSLKNERDIREYINRYNMTNKDIVEKTLFAYCDINMRFTNIEFLKKAPIELLIKIINHISIRNMIMLSQHLSKEDFKILKEMKEIMS